MDGWKKWKTEIVLKKRKSKRKESQVESPGWLGPKVLSDITELSSSALPMMSAPYCGPVLAHFQILALLTMADPIYSQLISCLAKSCITEFPWMPSDMVPETGTKSVFKCRVWGESRKQELLV